MMILIYFSRLPNGTELEVPTRPNAQWMYETLLIFFVIKTVINKTTKVNSDQSYSAKSTEICLFCLFITVCQMERKIATQPLKGLLHLSTHL